MRETQYLNLKLNEKKLLKELLSFRYFITPEEILEDKPYLTLAAIYTALAYYYANKESLDAEFANYEHECESLIAEYTRKQSRD